MAKIDVGSRVTVVRVENPISGLPAATPNLAARKWPGESGTILNQLGIASANGGVTPLDSWFVKHDDGSVAAYKTIELIAPTDRDQSAASAIEMVQRGPKPITGSAFIAAVKLGVEDTDGHAATLEYEDFKEFVETFPRFMASEITGLFAIYTKYAANGSIDSNELNQMLAEMQTHYEATVAIRPGVAVKTHDLPETRGVSLRGYLVDTKSLAARRDGVTGKVIGPVGEVGADQTANKAAYNVGKWWVQNQDGSVAAYDVLELTPI